MCLGRLESEFMKIKRKTHNQKAMKNLLIEIFGIDCQICHEEYYDEMHHIDKNPLNNTIENLILLCNTCHGWVHEYKNIEAWKIARKLILDGISIHYKQFSLIKRNTPVFEYVEPRSKIIDKLMLDMDEYIKRKQKC